MVVDIESGKWFDTTKRIFARYIVAFQHYTLRHTYQGTLNLEFMLVLIMARVLL